MPALLLRTPAAAAAPGRAVGDWVRFLGGETNQYYPALYEGTKPIEPEKTPEEGYHFTEDITDKAINWVRQQKALMPDKPFFVYFAPGATHAPHHVPPEWSAKYKGKFDQGWDKLREETFARQKQLGVIPPEADLTKRHVEIPAWDDIPLPMRPILARQMEVYAGFLEHTDYHVGRLIDALEDLEILDDTLIYYIVGDNGASAEGSVQGSLNEMITMNTTDQTLALLQSYTTPRRRSGCSGPWRRASRCSWTTASPSRSATPATSSAPLRWTCASGRPAARGGSCSAATWAGTARCWRGTPFPRRPPTSWSSRAPTATAPTRPSRSSSSSRRCCGAPSSAAGCC